MSGSLRGRDRERRIAREDEFTSHIASEAARRALEQAGIDALDIELIVVATITPDTLTPGYRLLRAAADRFSQSGRV